MLMKHSFFMPIMKRRRNEKKFLGSTLATLATLVALTFILSNCYVGNTVNIISRNLSPEVAKHNFYIPSHEKVIPIDDRKASANITYATFGPNTILDFLSANCLYSILGEHKYDIFILKYSMNTITGIDFLATRLRARFPDAIIIIMVNWYPFWAIVTEDGKKLSDWAEEQGYSPEMLFHDPKMHKEFQEAEEKWEWEQHIIASYIIEDIEKISEKSDSYISYMERPNDPKYWVDYTDYFDLDGHHLSKDGHLDMKNRIQEIVDRAGVPSHPHIGNWTYTDACS